MVTRGIVFQRVRGEGGRGEVARAHLSTSVRETLASTSLMLESIASIACGLNPVDPSPSLLDWRCSELMLVRREMVC